MFKRRSTTIPESARHILNKIPRRFRDDGLSWCPDSIFGFRFGWAGRIHDWRYCTRCHPAGSMTQAWRTFSDNEIRDNVAAAVPWRWRWIKHLIRFFLWKYGGIDAFDSCGPDAGEYCRHNIPQPGWMKTGIAVSNGPGNTGSKTQ